MLLSFAHQRIQLVDRQQGPAPPSIYPILFGEQMFHCALRLELRGPKDGSHMRRKAATRDCVGGIEFVSSGVKGEVVLSHISDSEAVGGRGRIERIQAIVGECWFHSMVHNDDDFKQAAEFVDGHPSLLDKDM